MTMNLEADGAPGFEIVRFRPDGSEFEIIYPKGSGHPSINPHYPFLVTDAYLSVGDLRRRERHVTDPAD